MRALPRGSVSARVGDARAELVGTHIIESIANLILGVVVVDVADVDAATIGRLAALVHLRGKDSPGGGRQAGATGSRASVRAEELPSAQQLGALPAAARCQANMRK